MGNSTLIIGSRASKLAVKQAQGIQDSLKTSYPQMEIELKLIRTTGDGLALNAKERGNEGIFVKEIEEALLRKDIDAAVHSLKDMPVDKAPGLKLAAVTLRENPLDVMVAKGGKKFDELPEGASVGTSSVRRIAQLLNKSPKINVKNMCGNVDTRLKKLNEGEYDAIVLAAAGLIRLGLEQYITEYFAPEFMLPSPGQGALGIQIRDDDIDTEEALKVLDDEETRVCVTAERLFLKLCGAGCSAPVGALARVSDGKICLSGLISSIDGTRAFKKTLCSPFNEKHLLAERLAQELFKQGADKVLSEIVQKI